MEISGGTVFGDLQMGGTAVATLSGGAILGQLGVRDDSQLVIWGRDFNLPLGEVEQLAGLVSGTLSDGTPMRNAFVRETGATLTLVPEPSSALLGLTAIAMLAVLPRQGTRASSGWRS